MQEHQGPTCYIFIFINRQEEKLCWRCSKSKSNDYILIFGVTQVLLEEVNIALWQDKNNDDTPSKNPEVGSGEVGCTQTLPLPL